MEINITLSSSGHSLDASVERSGSDLNISVDKGTITYPGPYTVTPSESTQTLYTRNLAMSQNVVVNPIPSNYGKITWNGSALIIT